MSVFLFFKSLIFRSVLSAWSSGTGAAGLFGSIAYAVLKALDVRTHTLLLSLVILPLIISVW